MTALAVAMLGIASTSFLLSIALYGAFLRFGQRKHAIFWAMAFACITLDHSLMALRLLTGYDPIFNTVLASIASLAGSTLVAMGFRERSGIQSQRLPIVAFLSTSSLCIALVLFFPANPVHHPLVSAYVVAMLALAISALRRGATAGLATGRLTMVMIVLFQIFFAGLTVLGFMTKPWGTLGPDTYRASYLLGVPASLTGIGLFALFLLAEDMAHDLRKLAIIDPLTGLLNRRGFEEAALRIKAQCRRSNTPVCVALVDLDHFKLVNDHHGHAVGDRVLDIFARRLRDMLREGDLVSRLGGEEFVLLLPGVAIDDVADLLDRLRQDLKHETDQAALGFPMPTASFGATQIDAHDTLADCLERADLALYEAKRDGRDCVQIMK